MPKRYLDTPDGRYFIVRDRLWRKANPKLADDAKVAWVKRLMDARRSLRTAESDAERIKLRERINEAKHALGERGPVWWTDGAPDLNRKLIKNTPYKDWYEAT